MASKNYAVLDIQNDEDELQFQDFNVRSNGSRSGVGKTHVFTDFPDSPGHQADTEKLLVDYDDDELNPMNPVAEGDDGSTKKSHSFWTFEFYQQFFDVDSKQVGDRIMWSMIPKPGVNFLEQHVRPKPDLYGPFWVCLTLVFAAAIAGNVSNYLQTQGDQTVYWRYDFHKVSLAAGMVFSYGWLLPLLLWSGLRYHSPTPALPLLELVCLYGYSLSVLVPVCIVWTVPIVWLRWCVGIVGVVLSGMVLARAVWEGLKGATGDVMDDEVSGSSGVVKKVAIVVVVVVVVMHIAIAMGFMLYFFSEPGGPRSNHNAPLGGSDPILPEGGPALPAAVANIDPDGGAVPGPAAGAAAGPAAGLNSSPTLRPQVSSKDVVPTKREVNQSAGIVQVTLPPAMNLVKENDYIAGDHQQRASTFTKLQPSRVQQNLEPGHVQEGVVEPSNVRHLVGNTQLTNQPDAEFVAEEARNELNNEKITLSAAKVKVMSEPGNNSKFSSTNSNNILKKIEQKSRSSNSRVVSRPNNSNELVDINEGEKFVSSRPNRSVRRNLNR